MIIIQYVIGALLAMAGGAFSFYFNGVYNGKASTKIFWVPKFCQIDAETCTSIVDTKFGRLLGRPNAELGGYFLFIYSMLLYGAAFQWISKTITLVFGMFTIFIGVYLVYGLIKLKTPCPICITIHGLNLIIFILQLV